MASKSKLKVRDHFTKKDNGTLKCNDCGASYKGTGGGSLRRHFEKCTMRTGKRKPDDSEDDLPKRKIQPRITGFCIDEDLLKRKVATAFATKSIPGSVKL